MAEAPPRLCVVPPRETYCEATGHPRGRALFRALQRLLEALKASRDVFPLVPPAALTKRAARYCRQKTPRENSAAGALSMVAANGPRCRGSPRGCRSLRGRAILHETLTAIHVEIDHALTAAANRADAGGPFPRCLRPGPLRRIIWVNGRVCI